MELLKGVHVIESYATTTLLVDDRLLLLATGLRVIFTPGHTRGSMSLLDETRSLLIAGDALNNEHGLGPMDDQFNVDPQQHRASIKRLATLQFDTAIFGHGAPMKGGASARVTELAKRL